MPDQSFENQQTEYKVEKILEKRLKSGKPEYRVKWEGYSKTDSTWEGITKLKKYAQMIDNFESKKQFDTESSQEEPKPKQVQSSQSSSSEKKIKQGKQTQKKTKVPARQLSSSSSSSVQREKTKKGKPSKARPTLIQSEKKDQRGRQQKSSSSEPVKKIKPAKKVFSSSIEEERDKKISHKKKEIRISSSNSSTKNGKNTKKIVNSSSSERSRSDPKQQVVVKDSQITQANEVNSNQGQFSLGDKPKDIVNIRKDVRNKKVEFLISWSNRRNGKIPIPVWVTDQQLKEKAPEILCEFLLKKIRWPQKD